MDAASYLAACQEGFKITSRLLPFPMTVCQVDVEMVMTGYCEDVNDHSHDQHNQVTRVNSVNSTKLTKAAGFGVDVIFPFRSRAEVETKQQSNNLTITGVTDSQDFRDRLESQLKSYADRYKLKVQEQTPPLITSKLHHSDIELRNVQFNYLSDCDSEWTTSVSNCPPSWQSETNLFGQTEGVIVVHL